MSDQSNVTSLKSQVIAERNVDRHIVDLDIESPTLGRQITVRLITPRDWSPGSARRWPTLYLLHGGDDGPSCWTDKTDVVQRVVAADVLAVLPSGGRAGFFTDWRRPDAAGTRPQWETFHLSELLPLVEQRYGGSSRRVVAGVSMGGYGAVTWAAKHPGTFAAVASYSGMLHTTRWGTPLLLRWFLHSVDERIGAMWGPRWLRRTHWAGADPYRLAERLRGTPMYLAAGDGTRPPGHPPAPADRLLEKLIGPATRELADKLTRLGHQAQVSVGPGVHAWPSWQDEIERSWPFLVRALTRVDTDDQEIR